MLCMSLFGGLEILVEHRKGARGEMSAGELRSETVIGIVLSRALLAELSGRTRTNVVNIALHHSVIK